MSIFRAKGLIYILHEDGSFEQRETCCKIPPILVIKNPVVVTDDFFLSLTEESKEGRL